MARARGWGDSLTRKRQISLAAGLAVAGCAAWAAVSAWRSITRVGAETVHALWLLPALMALHLFQLWLSARAWRSLLPPGSLPGPHNDGLFSLRVVREGINSLLPVAHVGGEAVGAQLLARRGPSLAVSAASVVVDMTLEFVTQLTFLLIGIAILAAVSTGNGWRGWLYAAAVIAVGLAGLITVQRFGVLRMVERLSRRIAVRWPPAARLTGLDGAAAAIYRRPKALLDSAALHLVAWMLGTAETWAVLHALGWPVGVGTALVVESLGMAARSAGFAIPGALVVQETGFALAAAAAGLPNDAGLSLSLVKRVREVAVGLIGLMLWRVQITRARLLTAAGREW